jgi:hypothetical protein
MFTTRSLEGNGLVPLSPWSWMCLPVYSHRQRERDYHYLLSKAKNLVAEYPAELSKEIGRSRSKGVAGKADVLKNLPKWTN